MVSQPRRLGGRACRRSEREGTRQDSWKGPACRFPARHPLAGLKLTNSTELHFQQGPITIFDGGEYADDARIADIPPDSMRLLSYAMDLDTEIVFTSRLADRVLVGLSIQQGGLPLKHLATRKSQYLIKNSGSHALRILIEQPVDADWPHPDDSSLKRKRRNSSLILRLRFRLPCAVFWVRQPPRADTK